MYLIIEGVFYLVEEGGDIWQAHKNLNVFSSLSNLISSPHIQKLLIAEVLNSNLIKAIIIYASSILKRILSYKIIHLSPPPTNTLLDCK